jgi:MerR family transcriptional regulator, copper efflux regulator
MKNSYSIGQLAKSTGIGIEAVRFYERKGLIPKPPRRPSGYRQFPQKTLERLLFIGRAKELGFSLAEIKDLLSLRINKQASCKKVKQRASLKLESIEEKLKTLKRMKKVLKSLIADCDEEAPTSQCPILDSLEGGKS